MSRSEIPGLALLACAIAFTAWYAAPELRMNRLPINDVILHLSASERMESTFEHGEPFLDSWVSEWGLGYPIWRSYQPLPHVAAAALLRLFRGFAAPDAIFAAFFYFLLIAFPVSVYIGARLLGLPPPAAGLAALLAFAPSANGDLSRFGIGYGSQVWRGAGLFTQLFALHLMAIAVGVTARALDEGKRSQRVVAGVLLALTALSHIIFGYAAFASAGLLAIAGPRGQLRQRLVRFLTIALPALLLIAWFVIPMALTREIINHSRWEIAEKWNSYGAAFILKELFAGRLLDAGRFPALTLLLAVGALGAVLTSTDARSRRLLLLTVFWLLMFFGRATFGRLVMLAGVPADMPMHRFQGVFELNAILLAAFGISQWSGWLAQRDRRLNLAVAGAVAIAIIPIAVERAGYMKENTAWGEDNVAAYQKEGPDLEAAMDDVGKILAERPGRVFAGYSNGWGTQFKVGWAPVYAFFSRYHYDQVSYLYHSMSKTSDIMLLHDEFNPVQDTAFAIRAVVRPAGEAAPAHLRLRSVHGRLAVFESSPQGYFGITDLVGHWKGPLDSPFDAGVAWLNSPLPQRGFVLSLDPRAPAGPEVAPGAAMPEPTPAQSTLRGLVASESKTGEVYSARVVLNQPAYALLRITWNPDLAATVDGRPAPLIDVTPGFGAVAVPAGQHDISVQYKPGVLKPVLFVFGILAFGLGWYYPGRPKPLAAHVPAPSTKSVVNSF